MVEVVEPDDGVAAPGELGRGVKPDEARGSREQEHRLVVVQLQALQLLGDVAVARGAELRGGRLTVPREEGAKAQADDQEEASPRHVGRRH